MSEEEAINPFATPASGMEQPPQPCPEFPLPLGAPVGLGGWLVLPLIGALFRPFIFGSALFGTYLPLWIKGSWQKLMAPTSASYRPQLGMLILFEGLVQLGLLIASIWLAVWFFRKSAKAPRMYIALLIAVPLMGAIDYFWAQQVVSLSESTTEKNLGGILKTIVAAGVWIPYFLKSERVRNTFTRP